MSVPDGNQVSHGTDDLFHHGVITKLFLSNNMGIVWTESGREVLFSFELVVLCGEAKSVQDLREGERVGYDIGWISNGLRVIKIKTYPQVSNEFIQANLEREKG